MKQTAGTAAKPKKPTGYFWSLGPHRMFCIADGKTQTVTPKLWEADAPTEAHDKTLMAVTTEINRVLEGVSKNPPEADLELSLIKFERRWMLAWAQPIRGGLGPHDDLDEIAAALHLRRD
jgi:hypothetical protein